MPCRSWTWMAMPRGKGETVFLDSQHGRKKKNTSPRKLLTSRSCVRHLLAPRLFSLAWDNVMVRNFVVSELFIV